MRASVSAIVLVLLVVAPQGVNTRRKFYTVLDSASSTEATSSDGQSSIDMTSSGRDTFVPYLPQLTHRQNHARPRPQYSRVDVPAGADEEDSLTSRIQADPASPSQSFFSNTDSKVQDPIFRFGVIADVQWADIEDGYDYAGTTRRCYRGALGVLRSAVDWWQPLKLDFVAQLGDLIDGQNAKLGMSVSAMDTATTLFDRLPCPSVHIVGNHDLYNFDRVALAERLDVGSGRRGDPPAMRREYFSFTPAKGWRVIALDSYQESMQGWAADDPRTRRALKTLAANNPNIDPEDPGKNGNWFEGLPQTGHMRRFVPYNGAYGREQLKWLRHELWHAKAKGERVILLSHTVLAPQACGGTTMAFDYDEALDIIRESGQTVVMVICGHAHKGGYHFDPETGTHHLTLCSPLNLGTDGKAFGIVDVKNEHIELRGPALRDLLPPSKKKGVPPAVPCERARDEGVQCEIMRFEVKKRSSK